MSSATVATTFAVDHSADTVVTLRGADRAKFLHGFCTNDIKGLTPGRGCEVFVPNHQGKTIGHGLVRCEEDQLVLQTVPGQAAKLIQHFDRFIITEDVVLADESDTQAKWLLAGEGIAERLREMVGEVPVKMLDFVTTRWGETPIMLQRVPYLEQAYLVVVPKDSAAEKAAELKTRDVAFLTDEALLTGLRIEAGWPLFGKDISDENLPQEIDRNTQSISFKKGCYLGQETIARLDALGHVNRILRRVSFVPQENALPSDGTELKFDGKTIGRLTSVGWSPKLQRPIGLAIVKVAQAKAGTQLASEFGTAEVLAATGS